MARYDVAFALRFAKRISEIAVGSDPVNFGQDQLRDFDRARLETVLRLLVEETAISRVSLWKIHDRTDRAALLACAWSDDERPEACVIDIPETALEQIFRQYGEKRERATDRTAVVHISDISQLKVDGLFVSVDDPQRFLDTRLLALPFGVPSRGDWRPRQRPHYLLNMIIPTGNPADEEKIPLEVLEAVVGKLTSGASALVDRRMRRITEAMTSIRVAEANEGGAYAVARAIAKVLPGCILCDTVLEVTPPGAAAPRCRVVAGKAIEPVSATQAEAIAHVAAEAFAEKRSTDPERRDSCVPKAEHRKRLSAALPHGPSGTVVETALFGRIHNHVDPENPRGYILLLNRRNEFAQSVCERSEADSFDWEDELYLNHICSVLDLITELFTAEEVRHATAQILAHEIHAPNGAIYATAERLLEQEEGRRVMPAAMRRRELDDIMTHTRLQSNLVDSMMLGLRTNAAPPSDRYVPERIDLDDIAAEVKRMVIPHCRKAHVEASRIQFGRLPRLVMDRRAATQIMMNLITNSIKYAGRRDPSGFSVRVDTESEDLAAMSASHGPPEALARWHALGVARLHLFSFADDGIGITEAFVPRAFASGSRDVSNPEVLRRQGAGLGLAVVRGLVRDHFGEIWIERQRNPTTFTVALPDLLESRDYTTRPQWRTLNGWAKLDHGKATNE